jgi:Ulp1 family protease
LDDFDDLQPSVEFQSPFGLADRSEKVQLNHNFALTDRLTVNELLRLEPGGWLNDMLIDLLMG